MDGINNKKKNLYIVRLFFQNCKLGIYRRYLHRSNANHLIPKLCYSYLIAPAGAALYYRYLIYSVNCLEVVLTLEITSTPEHLQY